MAWRGTNVITTSRTMIGATNPSAAAPGTVRGDFAVETGRNVIHGSDSKDSAKRELGLWFKEGTIDWKSDVKKWVYE